MTPPAAGLDRISPPAIAFLREALASSPSRWRNSLRLTLLCCAAIILVTGLHLPDGEFLVIFFFAVSQPDAWASLRKARLRGIGTLIGGALAALGIMAFGDQPWVWFVVQAVLFALALFLSRTTTIPYAVILAMFTFVIATPAVTIDPTASLHTVFWRILLTMLGAVLGTMAQLALWPVSPRKLLFGELASRLLSVEAILDGLQQDDKRLPHPDEAVSTGTVNQLNLLGSAEAGSDWVRGSHAEHVKLIMVVEAFLIAAVQLERQLGHSGVQNAAKHSMRLGRIRETVARFRSALENRQIVDPLTTPESLAKPIRKTKDAAPISLRQLEHAVRESEGSIAFLALGDGAKLNSPAKRKAADSAGGAASIFTPDCNLSNIEAMQFALKGSLAGSICYVLYQALNWPGISTCVVTTLIVAQTSFGAGLQKSVLRLLGAVLGGLMAALAIIGLMPNMASVASFVVVVGGLFFVAAWITTGNSRVSYVGLQVGLVLALVLLNQPGPTIDLTPAIDRVIGVLIGIGVMGFIDLALWPSFAGTALRRKLKSTYLALAEISRCASRREWEKAEAVALDVRRRLAMALSLYGESSMEFGSRAYAQTDRHRFLTIAQRLEETFFTLQTCVGHRRTVETALPEDWRRTMEDFDEAVARHLESMTNLEVPWTSRPGVDKAWAQMASQIRAGSILPSAAREEFEDYVDQSGELLQVLSRLEAEVSLIKPTADSAAPVGGTANAANSSMRLL